MNTKKELAHKFYQNLGKLFYAIAAIDNNVRVEELEKLKEIVKKEWLTTNFIEDDDKIKVEDLIINTFKWLHQENDYNAKTCFNSFLAFKKEHESIFTNNINALIIKTASAIAFSFSKVNKSELILLARLDMELKNNNIMNYYFTTTTKGSFEDIEEKVIALLKKEDFGVLTQIDIQQTLKQKLNIDFKKYKILGACNPPFAYKALKAEDKIGTMLPCNIIIQEHSPNNIEVSAINPLVSMQAVKNETLKSVAQEVSDKLENVIKNL